ncbi:chromosomal protein D1 [Syngnathus typhle]|uniref:chromosomal protein D1 n=1 Tax=Syngnathus typhle TaxID=161592 RepID=UPI002A69EEB8|nr:chromosomal protein D1 [Syngnathus typhle]
MEEEPTVFEEQGSVPGQQESNKDISVVKSGRGRPKGPKKSQISVHDVNLMELVSDIANNSSVVGFEDTSKVEDYVPKKRGRPKGSGSKRSVEKVAHDNGTDTPKKGRGRPKGSGKRKAENVTSEDESEEAGPTDSSVSKAPRVELGDDDNNSPVNNSPNCIATSRGRGRPRKSSAERRPAPTVDGPRRGRGRPKGSVNKKPTMSLALFQAGRPRRKQIPPSRLVIRLPRKSLKRGRPKKVASGRGRPRKYPLPSPEDSKNRVWKPLGRPRKHPIPGAAVGVPATRRGRGRPPKLDAVKHPTASYDGPPRKRGRPRKYPSGSRGEPAKPKVWKPLGRPRKYPLVDPPEGAPEPPRRTPGRPRKSASKRGAHLRNPALPRPPQSTAVEDGAPRKRGRPKNSGNKNKVHSAASPDDTASNHSDNAEKERKGQEAGEHKDDPTAQQQEEHAAAAEEGGTSQE